MSHHTRAPTAAKPTYVRDHRLPTAPPVRSLVTQLRRAWAAESERERQESSSAPTIAPKKPSTTALNSKDTTATHRNPVTSNQKNADVDKSEQTIYGATDTFWDWELALFAGSANASICKPRGLTKQERRDNVANWKTWICKERRYYLSPTEKRLREFQQSLLTARNDENGNSVLRWRGKEMPEKIGSVGRTPEFIPSGKMTILEEDFREDEVVNRLEIMRLKARAGMHDTVTVFAEIEGVVIARPRIQKSNRVSWREDLLDLLSEMKPREREELNVLCGTNSDEVFRKLQWRKQKSEAWEERWNEVNEFLRSRRGSRRCREEWWNELELLRNSSLREREGWEIVEAWQDELDKLSQRERLRERQEQEIWEAWHNGLNELSKWRKGEMILRLPNRFLKEHVARTTDLDEKC